MTRATATSSAQAGQPPAPHLAPLVAATLTAAGFRVTGPDPGDPAAGELAIHCPQARCLLTISPWGTAELDWTPDATPATDPHHVSDLAAALLAGPPRPRHPDAKPASDITFKGIVGMDMRAAGYTVTLDVHPDDYYYDVAAEITVTNPRAPAAGIIHVTDETGLTWHRDYWEAQAAGTRNPGDRTWLPDPAATAQAIAATITRALTTATASSGN